MKATIKNVPQDEVEGITAIAHKYNGTVLPMYNCSSTVNGIVATFDKQQDIAGFDITVCDLGYQLDWEDEERKEQTKSKTGIVPRDLRGVNSKGLLARQDNAIYIEADSFDTTWKVLRTRTCGSKATVMFKFVTQQQAKRVGTKIALAIGGHYYDTQDPRQLS